MLPQPSTLSPWVDRLNAYISRLGVLLDFSRFGETADILPTGPVSSIAREPARTGTRALRLACACLRAPARAIFMTLSRSGLVAYSP
jgi:hypothetical protein